MDSSSTANLDAGLAGLADGLMKTHSLENKVLFEKYQPMIDGDMWKKSEEFDGGSVTSFYAKSDEGKVIAKGVGYLPFKPEKVMKFYEKVENKPLFDDYFVDGKTIESIKDKANDC